MCIRDRFLPGAEEDASTDTQRSWPQMGEAEDVPNDVSQLKYLQAAGEDHLAGEGKPGLTHWWCDQIRTGLVSSIEWNGSLPQAGGSIHRVDRASPFPR